MTQATLALHAPEAEPAREARPTRPKRSRPWMRWAVAGSLLVSVGGWFAPAIVGRTALRHRFVHLVVPEYPGAASVREASLGWLSPVIVRDVTLRDVQGEEFVTIEAIRTSRSLASLAFAPGDDLGTVTFTKPAAAVRLRPDGSNLEDVLEPLLAGEGGGSGMRLVVDDGRLRWAAETADAKAGIDDLSVVVVLRAGGSLPERVELDGRLTDGETRGDFSASFLPAAGSALSADASIAATDVPLGSFQPWLDRFGAGLRASGKTSVDLVGTVALHGELTCRIDGRIDGRRVWLTAASLFGGETLQIDSVSLTGKAGLTKDRLTLDAVELQSQVGNLTANGQIGTSIGPASTRWEDRLGAVLGQDLVVTGSLDLARLATSFGPAVRLNQPIESGQMEFEIQTSAAEPGRRGTVKVRTTDLIAGAPGRTITWKEPLAADLALRHGPDGTVVEQLRVASEGVTLTGSGSLQQCEARFDADLDRLRTQLARIIDVPEGTLTGHATGRIAATRPDPADLSRVRFDATASVRDLSLGSGERRWFEKDLSLTAVADASLAGRIESADASLRSVEGDELTAKLTAPVDRPRESEVPLDVTLKGDLARWTTRAGVVAELLPAGWTAAGVVDASGSVTYGPSSIAAKGLSAEVKSLRVTMPGQVIDEPYVRLTGTGRWDAGSNVLDLASATLSSESASAKATAVVLPLSGDRPASGAVSFRGGAGRLGRYLLPPDPPVWLSGVAGGIVTLHSDAATTRAEAKLTFEKPVVSRPIVSNGQTGWTPVWSDEKATAVVSGTYRHAEDGLEVTSVRFDATGLSLATTGRIDRVSTVMDANLTGSLDCDLETFAKHLATGLPDGVSARGRSQRPFSVRGPLLGTDVSPDLTAKAGFGWDELRAFGVTIGAGQIAGQLARRELKFEPFDWPVAGGRVRGSANVSFDGTPKLTLAPGQTVDRINLTPDLCRTWLKYAAPSLADATEIQGMFSGEVQACQVPLSAPTSTEATAVLLVHGAEGTPGPTARSILDTVRQVQRVVGREETSGADLRLFVPPQNVAVRVVAGRVHHDRLMARLGNADGPTVATSGSVGFDETLDLIAEIPLDSKWFKDERVAAALGSQALRVPIRGTLSRPAPDPRAVQDLARRAASGALNGLIDRQLDKQLGDPLKKLFDRQ